MEVFVRWGPAHLIAIALTIAVPLFLAWWCRHRDKDRRTRIVGALIATILVGHIVVLFFWLDRGAAPRWQDMMPLHVCDLAVFACSAACITRKQFLFEVAYFWGLAGTIHGLVTPDLHYGFPAPQFWFFFIGHGGIVGSVIFMVVGMHLRPNWKSIVRAYGAMLAYAVVAGVFNTAFDTNYGYLCDKPASASLLDLLGPWPWYIGSLLIVGVVSFLILYVPWAVYDAARRRA